MASKASHGSPKIWKFLAPGTPDPDTLHSGGEGLADLALLPFGLGLLRLVLLFLLLLFLLGVLCLVALTPALPHVVIKERHWGRVWKRRRRRPSPQRVRHPLQVRHPYLLGREEGYRLRARVKG